jgi:hypothetical protein
MINKCLVKSQILAFLHMSHDTKYINFSEMTLEAYRIPKLPVTFVTGFFKSL